MSKKIKFGVALSVVLSAMAYLMYVGIMTGGMYYLTVSELRAQVSERGGEKLRINGGVVPKSVHYDSKNLKLVFTLNDEKTDETLKVVYRGAAPDLIEQEGVTLVAEGTYDAIDDTFHASNLLIKCPSKYEQQEGGEGPAIKGGKA